jgi:hypothetical protein
MAGKWKMENTVCQQWPYTSSVVCVLIVAEGCLLCYCVTMDVSLLPAILVLASHQKIIWYQRYGSFQ